jgi:hypothetical protein
MPCIVCKHNQVRDIDRALLTGVSLGSLSKTYGFSTAALHLHHQHLVQKMARAQQSFHDGLRQSLYCKLSIVMEMVFGVVRGARAGEDFKLFLQASREFTRIVSLMVKMDVRLDQEFTYCLMANPQWDLQEESHLPHSFQALAKTRQSLKVNLYAPCPELEPDLEEASIAHLETPNPALQPLRAGHNLEPPHRISAAALPHGREPENGIPANRRAVSAKQARN